MEAMDTPDLPVCEMCGRTLIHPRFVLLDNHSTQYGPFGDSCATAMARQLWKQGLASKRGATGRLYKFRGLSWGGPAHTMPR